MVLGLMYPTAGEVEIFGEQVTPLHNRVLRRVGTLVGSPSLMLAFSARRNLQTLAYLYPELPTSRVDEVLEQVGLADVGNRPVRKFSTGMKQRLGLALALYKRPDLLILDEPTNGMDPAGMQEIRLQLRSLAEQGVTVFLSSHLLHEMELLCDRVAVIQHGEVRVEGSVAELLSGKEVVRIRTTRPELTVQALQTLPEARHIVNKSPYVEVQGLSSEQVLIFLVAQKLTPQEVATSLPDLESVFLGLTRSPESSPSVR